MKLHEDRNAFKVLLSNIHERTGYREDVLEKAKAQELVEA